VTTGKPEPVTAELPAASERVLWEVAKLALESEQFLVVVEGFDPKTRSATSLWKKDLHPFRGEGYRERVHVSYEPGAPGRVELSVRVEKQINKNIAKPLDAEYADWHAAEDNVPRARVILQQIQSRLAPPPVVDSSRSGGSTPARTDGR
jgi:hypothetical protein